MSNTKKANLNVFKIQEKAKNRSYGEIKYENAYQNIPDLTSKIRKHT